MDKEEIVKAANGLVELHSVAFGTVNNYVNWTPEMTKAAIVTVKGQIEVLESISNKGLNTFCHFPLKHYRAILKELESRL